MLNFACMSSNKIYLAPLQEFTDAVYRKAHAEIFSNVDKYFTPYLVRQNDGTIKKSHQRDVQANVKIPLVPQILAGNAEDFIYIARFLMDCGYNEINWNLGCPYPMVTNKGMGSGLLTSPHLIEEILSKVFSSLDCEISVKMRSGFSSHEDLYSVIPVLNKFPLKEIILHPRITRQLYKGMADPEIFVIAAGMSKNPLVYNGDILTKADFDRLHSLFQNRNTWMIGRGILKNPFLPSEIKGKSMVQSAALLREFHDLIYYEYSGILSGKSHILTRMLKFWSYFCQAFPDPHKTLKRIKKSGSLARYDDAVNINFCSLTEHEKN
jgi:tRNA-dihydrouridine synthase